MVLRVLGVTTSSELLEAEAQDFLTKNSGILRLQVWHIYKALSNEGEYALALSANNKTLDDMRHSPSFNATQSRFKFTAVASPASFLSPAAAEGDADV